MASLATLVIRVFIGKVVTFVIRVIIGKLIILIIKVTIRTLEIGGYNRNIHSRGIHLPKFITLSVSVIVGILVTATLLTLTTKVIIGTSVTLVIRAATVTVGTPANILTGDRTNKSSLA